MSEESEEKKPAEENKITTKIIESFLQFYAPSGTGEPELKTTLDLVEEMSAVADVGKWEIQAALQLCGFQIKYCDAGPVWVLYRKMVPQA